MAKARLKRFFFDNGLTIFMFGLFVLFLIGLMVTGYIHTNQDLQSHQQPLQSFGDYLISGDFIEAVFENWESEFLQMAALVVATIYLRQKGAADSRKLIGKDQFDSSSRFSIIAARNWRAKRRALGRMFYANSLSLALIGLFILSFTLHAIGGTTAHNETAQQHHETQFSILEYVRSSQFWFESFQNWQSEFLAVGTLLLLSVYLRQQHSPESKPVSEGDQKTGD